MRCIHDGESRMKGEGSAAFTRTITMMENIKIKKTTNNFAELNDDDDVEMKALKVQHDEIETNSILKSF